MNIKNYIETRIERVTESGCWIWLGSIQTKGYGDIRHGNTRLAHRASFEAYKGSIPKNKFILMGPGRWGSRGDIKLGVPVNYGDIKNTSLLIEIAKEKGGYIPELSFGTHFFQDLVETNIKYLPLYPDNKNIIFNEDLLVNSINNLVKILPHYKKAEFKWKQNT